MQRVNWPPSSHCEWESFLSLLANAVNSGHDQGAYSACMGIRCPKLNFSQFVNQNVKILGRRLYSPSLKDVDLLEVAELILFKFSIHPMNRVWTFVYPASISWC